MLDIKYVRENLEEVIRRENTRNGDYSYLREIPVLDEKRKELIKQGDALKQMRNEQSKLVGQYKREGKDATEIMAKISASKEDIAKIDVQIGEVDAKIKDILLKTPNLPDPSLPLGKDDSANVEVRKWGTPRKFDFAPLAHWDLGTKLGYFDFDRAIKVSGPRFTFYKGLFARLERSVMMFMLDTHVASGYTEILPPYMVNTDTMTGTGQLPKFADQAYKIEGQEMWMIPTAEVPVTNYYRDEILDAKDLPYHFCAYSSCFREEAGSAGRDTRGIIRQHQFQKVEMVKICLPENSWAELDEMTAEAGKILELLNLPYHVVCLSTGDVGFSSAKTFDLEVWLPSYNAYKEISSCSNCLDFQARRMNLRFKRTKDSPTEFCHTLNGSGLAIGRTVAAIIENYQQADGTIVVPEVLRKYMGVDIIK
ncbi:MAG: serine--tRNA ligase [Bacilli bacterium]|jgi:seryl-tRNA synthetase|nr:serine--tRNA ligase [Bacilli bacterium]